MIFYAIIYSIVPYYTVLYPTTLYYTILYCIVLYCTMIFQRVLYCTIRNIMLYYTIPKSAPSTARPRPAAAWPRGAVTSGVRLCPPHLGVPGSAPRVTSWF